MNHLSCFSHKICISGLKKKKKEKRGYFFLEVLQIINKEDMLKLSVTGTPLVVQYLGIHLPMQGIQV